MRLRVIFSLLLLIISFGQATMAVAGGENPWATTEFGFYQPTQDSARKEVATAQKEPGSVSFESAEGMLDALPSDQFSSRVLPVNLESLKNDPDDLWERMRSGFLLAELDSPLVQDHEAWYANRPDYVRRTVQRSQRYLFHIVQEVEKRGMPTEIALLPFIESAYNPKAYSTSHASGIWQFIPSTGKYFGLDQNFLYDGRRDIISATDAALDYLQKLHDMFDSWELALAAYNWGEGSVSRAIARNRAKGEPTDYLSLNMPPETRNYVPKLIAVRNIIRDPAAFGLTLNVIPNRSHFGTVKVTQQMDLSVAARLAEMPMDEFVALNPAYNKPLLAGTGKPTLLLPVDKVDRFNLNLANNAQPLSSWQTYSPLRGEKLDNIARRFGISVGSIKEANAIGSRKKQLVPQTLLIPSAKSGDMLLANIPQAESIRETPLSKTNTHTVVKGDTVFSIAHRYDMSVAQLKTSNHLKSNQLAKGQKLTVLAAAKPDKLAKQSADKPVVAASKSSEKHAKYVVKRGDTVFSIARRFNIAVNDLQRWNNIQTSNSLQPGHTLTVSRKG